MAKKKPDTKDNTKGEVEALANKLLSLMGTKADVTVSEDSQNSAFIVSINAGDEAGLLIGRRGETLLSFQMVLGVMVRQKLGEWVRIVVDVGDWREKEEGRLKSLAVSAAERAKETRQPQPLYNLSAAERRVVHLVLSEDPGVETESLGEDAERYLVVKPK